MIAIVGRPNVGKSTLFNRLTQSRTAITNDEAGTTRDRQYGKVDWNGKEFSIVDTGGWVVNSEDIFENEINKQVYLAIEQADEILFVVDAANGVTDLDDKVAQILRRSTKPVILVANKVDTGDSLYNIAEFYSLGLGDPMGVSAVSGYGTGDLLDEVVKKMPEKDDDESEQLDDIPKIAIVGRPNAGKSSIINAFIDEERHIVTDIAGTTRDSIYTRYNKFGFDFYLVDTAGIRKKTKVTEDIEYYSVIQRNKKGLVVVVNKWDLVQDKSKEAIKHYEDSIRSRFAPFVDFPIIFASALTKQRIFKVLETALQVCENRRRIVPTSQLNTVMLEAISAYPPPANKGKFIKIKYVTMLKGSPIPTFIFFCNLPQWVKEPYRRYLENKIRENWDFHGTPINVFMREK